jgi:hypothetical protein
LLLALVAIFLWSCNGHPTYRTVQDYDEPTFIADMMIVADGGAAPKRILDVFDPIRVEPHLNGAWIVIVAGGNSESGIYVDRTSAAWIVDSNEVGLV